MKYFFSSFKPKVIAINTGCLNECTYCKTKHARGELGSYDVEEIVERVKQSFEGLKKLNFLFILL